MQHDSLTAGVLTRLDALTAKLGVGADALWSLWLHTWWRPMLSLAFTVLTVAICATLLRLMLPRVIKVFRDMDNELIAVGGLVAGMALTIGLCVSLIDVIQDAPNAIAYAINHQLYALDQLRGVLGR